MTCRATAQAWFSNFFLNLPGVSRHRGCRCYLSIKRSNLSIRMHMRSFTRLTNAIYSFTELDELVLAYATTIHKSQGSEYPAVVIPLSTQHYAMLQRNLVYTGVTRGKRLLSSSGSARRSRSRSREVECGDVVEAAWLVNVLTQRAGAIAVAEKP